MNLKFLNEAFARIPKETIQIAVSNINAYRNFIGNGVAVGKLAEVIVAKMFCNPEENVHGFSFAFTGKNPPFDIMVYQREEALTKEAFTSLRRLYQIDFATFCRAIDKAVGSNNWCGISLKNYLNHESQLTTNYKIRTICEDTLGQDFKTHQGGLVQEVLEAAKAELSHESILLMNSFPDTRRYQFRLFNLDALPITYIQFTQKSKHTRYVFGNDQGPIFHVKYGKNQANPFQRGLWVDDLDKLPLLNAGTYGQSAFGKYILDGALLHHKVSSAEEVVALVDQEDGGELALS